MSVTSRELLCGLTYADCISVAGMSQREAANRLGVNYAYFNHVVKRLGMSHWYIFERPRKLSRSAVAKVGKEGYTQRDAAYLLDVDYSCFRDAVKLYGLRHLFPNCGEASAIAKRGYCT